MKCQIAKIYAALGFVLITSSVAGQSHTAAQMKEVTPDTSLAIVKDVDTAPQFRGGVRGWQTFLMNNMDISSLAERMDSTMYVDYGARQTAVLEFTVCEDGEVCDVAILNKSKISPEFAKEALRVMKRSPKWVPAQLNDKPVRTRFRQSITAVIQ